MGLSEPSATIRDAVDRAVDEAYAITQHWPNGFTHSFADGKLYLHPRG